MEFNKNTVRIILSVIIIPSILSSQISEDSLGYNLSDNIEIKFTHRNSTSIFLQDTGRNKFNVYHIPRIQIGYEFISNQYLHLYSEFIFHRSNIENAGDDFNAYGIGVAYSYKATHLVISANDLGFNKEDFFSFIAIYPELTASIGYTSLKSSTLELNSLESSSALNLYWSYSTSLNCNITTWLNLSLQYQFEYYPSVKVYSFDDITDIVIVNLTFKI